MNRLITDLNLLELAGVVFVVFILSCLLIGIFCWLYKVSISIEKVEELEDRINKLENEEVNENEERL